MQRPCRYRLNGASVGPRGAGDARTADGRRSRLSAEGDPNHPEEPPKAEGADDADPAGEAVVDATLLGSLRRTFVAARTKHHHDEEKGPTTSAA
jgi:hypothetical protein